MIRSFVIAWHFLTAIPLSSLHHDPAPHELAQSMSWFPLIGLVLGGLLAAADLLSVPFFPYSIVNLLLIVLLVLLTRGLHIDGLADVVDGLAGGRTPAERLTIMRDAHIGAIGATGLMLGLGLRYAGLMAIPSSDRLAVLLSMPAAGRWAMVISAVAAPYARPEGGIAQPFLQQLSARHVIAATAVLAGIFIWSLGPVGALVGCGLVALIARGATWLACRLLGGITGDTLGATNEMTEIVFLIMAPILAGLGAVLFAWQ
jgi:adenosylcobinamide-GDP ribazoletransferase